MTDLLAALITGGVPTLTVLIGIFYNNKRTDDLRSEVRQGFSDINKRIDDTRELLRAEMRETKTDLKADIREMSRMVK